MIFFTNIKRNEEIAVYFRKGNQFWIKKSCLFYLIDGINIYLCLRLKKRESWHKLSETKDSMCIIQGASCMISLWRLKSYSWRLSHSFFFRLAQFSLFTMKFHLKKFRGFYTHKNISHRNKSYYINIHTHCIYIYIYYLQSSTLLHKYLSLFQQILS